MHKPLILFLVLAIVGAFFFWLSLSEPKIIPFTPEGAGKVRITLGGTPVFAEIADTDEERARGLGGRVSLAPQEGLLFVFDQANTWEFWMKDMRFPLDIIWINDAHTIVDIKRALAPSSYPEVFTPKGPARYVLELNAGFSEVHGIEVGEALTFDL